MDIVLFFYSPLPNRCEWAPDDKDIAFSAPNEDGAFAGGICIYTSRQNRLYACPAPDRYACFAFRYSRSFSESPMYVEIDRGFGLLIGFSNIVSVGLRVKPALTTPRPIPTSLPTELAREAKRCSVKTA